jgi:hypothetical protein
MKQYPMIKILIVAALSFALFGLFIQFVFSYGNQSEFGPQLTIINFAAPFALTVGIILFFILSLFSKSGLRILASKPNKLKIPLFLLFTVLLIWQMRYIIKFYGIKQRLDMGGLISELFPMVAGSFVTLFILLSMLNRGHRLK